MVSLLCLFHIKIIFVNKIFLLGLGSAKCGTTWLHDQLKTSSHFAKGIANEYHMFDALTLPHGRKFAEGRRIRLAKLVANKSNFMAGGNSLEVISLLKLCSFHESQNEYYEYFRSLLFRSDKIGCAADITPLYAGLSYKTLSTIKLNFESLGIKPKVCFLMRDPVSRMWSAARHRCKYMYGLSGFSSQEANQTVLERYMTQEEESKSRYEIIIPKILSVFGKDDVFLAFFEDLFTLNSNKRLSRFLNINDIKFKNNKASNVGEGGNFLLDDEIAQLLFEHYKPTYRFVFEMFDSPALVKWRLPACTNL